MHPSGGWRPWLPLLLFVGLLVAAAAAYYPGLSGPFLFDDWANLPALGAWGPVNNMATLVSYLTSGIAGPTGRPLALASFLMDARDWPANPWPFKLTNLLLHLLNGVVLAALLVRLSRRRGLDREAAAWAGVLGASLWLLHPLFVSTTLYVVQRMTELATFAVFAGLLAYVHGHARLFAGRAKSGYAWMIAGIVGGSLVGALAKENALLLPLLALVLEFTVLRDPGKNREQARSYKTIALAGNRKQARCHASSRPSRAQGEGAKAPLAHKAPCCPVSDSRTPVPCLAFRVAFLWLPSLALVAYVLAPLAHLTRPIAVRSFTIATRLLTESRVLVHYLYLLVIPHVRSGGLFYHVTPSANLLVPWTTLPSLLLIAALIAFAVAVRRRQPALAAAILFYFAGQLIESTTVPLELYFEHRNYLPAALLFWPLALWIVRGRESTRLRAGVAGLALVLLCALTALRSDLWSDAGRLAQTWMREDAGSARAIVWGAESLAAAGRPRLALDKLRAASRAQPADIAVALERLETACEMKMATADDLAAAVTAAERGRRGSRLIYQGVGRLETHTCSTLGPARLIAIPVAALANPHFARYPALQQAFLVLQGQLLLREGRTDAASRAFTRALPLDAKPDTALIAAAAFYLADKPRFGLRLLREYRRLPKAASREWSMARLHRWWLARSGWYRESFRRVHAALEQELRRSSR